MKYSRTWRDFWNSEHSIYVSERHKHIHYDVIARDVLKLVPERRPLVFLDYGCGDALSSYALADAGISVLLYDPVPLVYERIRKSFANVQGITVLENVYAIKDQSVDVLLVNSVLQYMSKDDFKSLLPVLRRLLRENGQLIVADVVPAHTTPLHDVSSLLKNAWEHGYALKALQSLFRTFFSDYGTIRKTHGFSTYTEEEFKDVLTQAGFISVTSKPNIGPTSHRMTFVAQ